MISHNLQEIKKMSMTVPGIVFFEEENERILGIETYSLQIYFAAYKTRDYTLCFDDDLNPIKKSMWRYFDIMFVKTPHQVYYESSFRLHLDMFNSETCMF